MRRWIIALALILLLGSLIVWRIGQKRAETAARGSMQAARGKAPASRKVVVLVSRKKRSRPKPANSVWNRSPIPIESGHLE